MKYDKPAFLLPPRPERVIPPTVLPTYQNGSWIAQPKMNGTYNEIIVTPDRDLITFKRDGSRHRAWKFSPASAEAFKAIPGDGWYVFCAELLHSKTPHIKDTNYVHDVLVANSEPLRGLTYLQRYQKLGELFPDAKPDTGAGYLTVNDHTWLAAIYNGSFRPLFDRLTKAKEVEGLVLKNTKQRFNFSQPSNGMFKCRRPSNSYSF